jgi:hypothetical protein
MGLVFTIPNRMSRTMVTIIQSCFFGESFVFKLTFFEHQSHEWWKWQVDFQYLVHQFCILFFFNRIWIQFKLHAMLFNIFIQMKLNFHKSNSFFHHCWYVGCINIDKQTLKPFDLLRNIAIHIQKQH